MNCPYPKFEEWLAMREGLWLADKNAVTGMSRLDPLPVKNNKPPVPNPTSRKTTDPFKVLQPRSQSTRVPGSNIRFNGNLNPGR
jgi:hypothetical protein